MTESNPPPRSGSARREQSPDSATDDAVPTTVSNERRLSRRTVLALSVGSIGSLAGCTVPFLSKPEPPDCTGNQITELPAPTSGPDEAPTTVAIFTDFACPHCRDFFTEAYPDVRDRISTNAATFVHHDFPIPVSKWSYPVANAARAVQNTKSEAAFWKFSKQAYQQESYSTTVLEELARKTGADPKTVRRASEQLPYCQLLKQERKHGSDRGVKGTPTVFVNDQKLEAPSADELTDAITGATDQ